MPKSEGMSGRNWLYVRVVPHVGWSNYRAWGDGIEFRGATLGYTKDIEEILRRMVRAEAEPPELVVKTARLLFEHIESQLRYPDTLDDIFVGTTVEHKDPESPYSDFTMHIEVRLLQVDVMDNTRAGDKDYLGPAEPGWMATITVTYVGYDGYDGDGKHMVRRRVVFKGRVDSDVLWGEMMRVIRHAFNALPTK